MRNIKLVITYDGTEFHGWQRQPNLRTVQQVLEDAIAQLTGVLPKCNATSRTDAGVHAFGQVVNFFTSSTHSPRVFVKGLNATMPHDLRVRNAWEMPESFHATLDAKRKLYRYTIDNGPISNPFCRRYAWHVYHSLDAEAMNRAGQSLIGRHDFRSFETNWPNRVSSVRTLFRLNTTRDGTNVTMEVEADGFLYNMVRAITGTLVLVGTGQRPESFVADALKAQSRSEAGMTAPPQGLSLIQVWYED